jgi:maltooligosyltrehalose trehalohydrolase
VPDPQDPATFARSRLDWDERVRAPHADLLAWYRALIMLRRLEPALSAGPLDGIRADADDAAGWLQLRRPPFTIAANLSDHAQAIPSSGGNVVLASDDGIRLDAAGLACPPWSVAVTRPDR